MGSDHIDRIQWPGCVCVCVPLQCGWVRGWVSCGYFGVLEPEFSRPLMLLCQWCRLKGISSGLLGALVHL